MEKSEKKKEGNEVGMEFESGWKVRKKYRKDNKSVVGKAVMSTSLKPTCFLSIFGGRAYHETYFL